MKYIKVRNWERWQSYRKDRGLPPWIKVHRRIMRDPEWVSLTDAERGQLVAIWLLAADKDGAIPASQELIQKLCFLDAPPDLNKFTELGFLENGWCQDDVKLASSGCQDGCPKAEAKAEAEKKTPLVELKFDLGCLWCVWRTYLDAMNRNPNQYKFTKKRKSKIKARLKDSTRQEIYNAIIACRDSSYHQGKNENGTRYQDICDHVLISREKVEWWNDRPKPKKSIYR